MDNKPIKTEADYDAALQRIGILMDAEMDTPEGDEQDVLVTLVEAYESRHHPIDPPNGTRPLSIDMIRKLWKGLHIPLESLIGDDNSNNHQHA